MQKKKVHCDHTLRNSKAFSKCDVYLRSFANAKLQNPKKRTKHSKTLLASFAKSKSLTSDMGTELMANASLSSFMWNAPICSNKQRNYISFHLQTNVSSNKNKRNRNTLSITGRSSSTSMGMLVLVTQVFVHKFLSLTYEFLKKGRYIFSRNQTHDVAIVGVILIFQLQEMPNSTFGIVWNPIPSTALNGDLNKN